MWVKYWIEGGSASTSREEEYVWYEKPQTEELYEDAAQEWADGTMLRQCLDYYRCGYEVNVPLPEEVRAEKIKSAEARIRGARWELALLQGTPCGKCLGMGRVTIHGDMENTTETCDSCKGSGRTPPRG
jgi:hypothetical protein